MKTKAKLVLLVGLLALPLGAIAQTQETLPSVPRADGTGPSIPSMANPGDARGSRSSQATAVPERELNADRPAAVPPPAGTPRSTVGERSMQPPAASATGPISLEESLDTTAAVQRIETTPWERREELLGVITARVRSGDVELDEVRRSAFRLTGQARKTHKALMKDFKKHRRMLDEAMEVARKSHPAVWPQSRHQLALKYAAYWVTLTQISGSLAGVPLAEE